MPKFFLYLLKLGCLSLVVALVLQLMADTGLRKMENTAMDDWVKILDGSINSDLIILGSSRSYTGYDPTVFEKNTGLSSYNLSLNAAPFSLQQIKLERYLANNKAPKVIVQNVDLTHFQKSKHILDPVQFLPFLGNKALSNDLSAFDREFRLRKWVPLYKYNTFKTEFRLGLQSFFGDDISILKSKKGYAPKDRIFKADLHNLKRIQNHVRDSTGFMRNDEYVEETFRRIKNREDKDQAIFMVWAPEIEVRRELATQVSNPLKEKLSRFAEQEKNVFFLDYSADPIANDTINFYDTFHLNRKGATLFSEKVSMKINELLTN